MTKAAVTIEVYADRRGEWRARIRHRNNDIIWCTSEGYNNKSGVLNAIKYIDKQIPVELPEGFTDKLR